MSGVSFPSLDLKNLYFGFFRLLLSLVCLMHDVLYVHKVLMHRDLFASNVQSWEESFLDSQMVFLLNVPKAGEGNGDEICAPLWLGITFSIGFMVIISGVAVDMRSDKNITFSL